MGGRSAVLAVRFIARPAEGQTLRTTSSERGCGTPQPQEMSAGVERFDDKDFEHRTVPKDTDAAGLHHVEVDFTDLSGPLYVIYAQNPVASTTSATREPEKASEKV